MTTPDASLGYLLGRVALLELTVRGLLAARAGGPGVAAAPGPAPTGGPDPSAPPGFLSDALLSDTYLSDAYVPWLAGPPAATRAPDAVGGMADRLERETDGAEARGVDIRLRRLCRAFGLDDMDRDLLVAALAPTLDRRFGPLLAALADDARGAVTVALATELVRGPVAGPPDPRDAHRLAAGAPLLDEGLVEVADDGSPLPLRAVRVADRVTAFLLGDDRPDARLAEHVARPAELPLVDPALAALGAPRTVHLVGRAAADPAAEAAAWLVAAGGDPLVVELPGPTEGVDADGGHPVALLDRVLREGLLTGRVPVVGPVDAVALTHAGRGRLARLTDRLPVAIVWSRAATPAWAGAEVPVLTLDVPPVAHRRAVWARLTDAAAVDADDVRLLAQRHRIGTATAVRAAQAAAARPARAPTADTYTDTDTDTDTGTAIDTSTDNGRPDRAALEAALRAHDARAMQGHARRLDPRRTWSDLVLPVGAERRLRELVALVRHRDAVVDEWGLGRGGGARGVCALFAGRSGTGKTLAAEVVAGELGVSLYTVDLARVVDKYVGETEKNLDAVLSAAEGVSGVLFFDEADALFGRRGEIRGGQDRYANLEVSYLLQRIEAAGAVVLLATNLRSQVDEAFLRRLDAVVEFAEPDGAAREAIWRRHLRLVEVATDADVEFCARTFALSGGSIRNAVTAAACLAAEAGRPVATAELVRAVEREYEKLGRLRVQADFGRYADLLEARS